MKKKTLTLLLAVTTIATLTACGQPASQEGGNQTGETISEGNIQEDVHENETQEPTPSEDEEEQHGEIEVSEPSNDFEKRVGKTTFDSYDEIIGLLNEDEAYALVNVKGYTGEVLFISNATFDDSLGHIATTDCSLYSMKANGMCTYDNVVYSSEATTPVTIDAEGVIYSVMDGTIILKGCYGENGTEDPAYIQMASVTVDEFDDAGEPVAVSGFIRNTNSLLVDDGFFLRGNDGDIDIYKEISDTYYNNSEVINFTRIDGTVAQ